MKTKPIYFILVMLFFTANLYGQNAYDMKQSTYTYGAYTPNGSTGAYYESLHFKYELTGVKVSSDNQNEYNKVQITMRTFPGKVNRYKYNGKTYSITDICGTFVGLGFLDKFTMAITITGVGTRTYTFDKSDVAVFSLNKHYTSNELKQIKVTNVRLVTVYPHETAVKEVERCLNRKQTEKQQTGNKSNIGTTKTSVNSTSPVINTKNSSTTSSNPYMEEVKEYNSKIQADAEALDNATDQTTDAWSKELAKGKNADFISTSKPLVQEFAKQGNAGAAYGTMGVAVGAQVLSMISSGKTREQRQQEKINKLIEAGIYELKKAKEAEKQKNFPARLDWSLKDINKNGGHPRTYFYVAHDYYRGENGAPPFPYNDYRLAYQHFEKSAEGVLDLGNNNEYAAPFYFLGYMNFLGKGTEINYEKAYLYFREGSDRTGYTDFYTAVPRYSTQCKFFLAYILLTGKANNTKDEKYAEKLFEEIFRDEHLLYSYTNAAAFALGKIYYDGLGVAKDLEKARGYFIKSADYNLFSVNYLIRMSENNQLGKEAKKAQKIIDKYPNGVKLEITDDSTLMQKLFVSSMRESLVGLTFMKDGLL